MSDLPPLNYDPYSNNSREGDAPPKDYDPYGSNSPNTSTTPQLADPMAQSMDVSLFDMLEHGNYMGIMESVHGVTQMAGFKEEEMREKYELLKQYQDHPEHGGKVTAAYFAGMVLDPVGWALPVSKLRHIKTGWDYLTKAAPMGALSGGIAGGVGYVDEEAGQTRAGNAAIGLAGGSLIGPAAVKVAKTGAKVYEPIGDMATKALANPSVSGGALGGLIGYNISPDASEEDKRKHAMFGAVMGAAPYAGMKGFDNLYGTKSVETVGKAIIPNYKLADDMIYAMNRFRAKQGIFEGDWQELTDGIRELPVQDRRALYRMLQSKNFGLTEGETDINLIGIASGSREKIKEYGQALVNLGLLDDKTFTKNIDDYLTTSYLKHEENIWDSAEQRFTSSHHMFRMRGKIEESFDRAQWERGKRPDDLGEWELLDTKGSTVRVRRQWTKDEKLDMGEIEDAGFAMWKTGKMFARERSIGELFTELSKSPEVVFRDTVVLGPNKTVRIPNNKKLWGDMAGKSVKPETFDQLKILREWKVPEMKSKLFSKYKKANGVWKGTKTILEEAVHLANVVSSGHMFDMAGGHWADVGRAAKNMYKKDEMFQQMLEDGVFGAGFMRELNESSAEILRTYGAEGNAYLRLTGSTDSFARAMDWTTKIGRKIKEGLWDNPGKLYQLEDNIWRAALYRTNLEKYTNQGMDIMKARGKAARDAKEFFVDYDQKPPVLEAVRHTFLPFFSYTYGTIPKLAQIAAKNPAKYAKWAMIYYMMDELGTNLNVLPEDYIEEAKKYAKSNPMFGIPGMMDARVTLPSFMSDTLVPDGNNPVSLNTERYFPGGKFSTTEGGVGQFPGLPEMAQPGGGLAGAGLWSWGGVNPFTGSEIPDGERMNTFIRQALPNWGGNIGEAIESVTGNESYALKKERRAEAMDEQGITNHSRIDDYTPLTAELSNAGIRVDQLDINKMKRRIKSKWDRKIRDKKTLLSKLRREPVTEARRAEHQRKIDSLQADIRRFKKMKRDALENGR